MGDKSRDEAYSEWLKSHWGVHPIAFVAWCAAWAAKESADLEAVEAVKDNLDLSIELGGEHVILSGYDAGMFCDELAERIKGKQ